MITILLDTSGDSLSVGIANENEIIDYISYEAWHNQSEILIPELDKLMSKNNIKNSDIDCVMVTIGPGSYTGIRIALTSAKIISMSLNAQIIPVSSLQVLKDGNKPSICLANARCGRSYFGVYQGNKIIVKDQVMLNEDVLKYIDMHNDYVVRGDVSYLGLKNNLSNIVQEMYSLRYVNEPAHKPLAIKPIYILN